VTNLGAFVVAQRCKRLQFAGRENLARQAVGTLAHQHAFDIQPQTAPFALPRYDDARPTGAMGDGANDAARPLRGAVLAHGWHIGCAGQAL